MDQPPQQQPTLQPEKPGKNLIKFSLNIVIIVFLLGLFLAGMSVVLFFYGLSNNYSSLIINGLLILTCIVIIFAIYLIARIIGKSSKQHSNVSVGKRVLKTSLLTLGSIGLLTLVGYLLIKFVS